MLFLQFSVNFQNSEMTRHLSSSLRLDPGLVCDVSWGIDLRSEKHRETKERKKSLSGVCSMGVLLQINIFAGFKLFLCLKVKLKRCQGQNLQMNSS